MTIKCELLGKDCTARDPRYEGWCGSIKNAAHNPTNPRVCTVADQHAYKHGLRVYDHGKFQVFFRDPKTEAEADYRQGQWPGGDQLPPEKKEDKKKEPKPAQAWVNNLREGLSTLSRSRPSYEQLPLRPELSELDRAILLPSALYWSEGEQANDFLATQIRALAHQSPYRFQATALVEDSLGFDREDSSPVFGGRIYDYELVKMDPDDNPIVEFPSLSYPPNTRQILLITHLDKLFHSELTDTAIQELVTALLERQKDDYVPLVSISASINWQSPLLTEETMGKISSLFPDQAFLQI